MSKESLDFISACNRLHEADPEAFELMHAKLMELGHGFMNAPYDSAAMAICMAGGHMVGAIETMTWGYRAPSLR